MLETPVLEDNDVTGIKLLPEYRLGLYRAVVGHVLRTVQICFRTIPYPVEDVENNEFLVVVMRLCHYLGEGPEQINAERAVRSPPVRRYQLEKGTDQVLGLGVGKELDPGMLALARDVRPIGDRDHIVFLQVDVVVVPLVTNDVASSLAVDREVSFVMTECRLVEVRLEKNSA